MAVDFSDKSDINERCYLLQKSVADPKEVPYEPEVPNLPTDPDEPDVEQPISVRLGMNKKSNYYASPELTEQDGNEDPGSELDKEFSGGKS